uniref:Aldehyde dehydrogenase domain-containing protein n=1 Tax=Panagrolaimus sp. ES5 TaxID=591445 RepID=A0AC34GT60_9BILA
MQKFVIPKNLTKALHFINGVRVNLGSYNPTFDVFEPRNGQVLATVEEAKRSDIEEAAQAALGAQEKWSLISPAERGIILRRVSDIIRHNVDDISVWEVRDNGKSISEAKADILSCADTFDYFSGVDLNGEHIPLDDAHERFAYTRREPLGVVGCIGAWNFPMQTASWKIAPAIACGNAVVYKPSPLAPVSAVILAHILHHVGVPDGLVNVVQGGAKTGAAICQSRAISKVSFTGSVTTGNIIAQNAASDFVKPVTLELGGKSSCIIFEDSNIELAVTGAMMANFFSQGQVCSNASKVLVHKSILEPFTKALVERTSEMIIGDPLNEATRIGATISIAHLEKVKGYIDGAVEEGAHLIHGGNRAVVNGLPNGYFLEPCILSNITPQMKVYKDEIFGSVLLIIPFDTDEEALRIANDTPFGLAAGIFTSNLSKAHGFARKIHAGNVYINTFNDVSPYVPFGGYKQSGYGRENGKAAIDYYTQYKSVFVNASNKLENPF